jgi:hypothetical protein
VITTPLLRRWLPKALAPVRSPDADDRVRV